MDNRDIKFIDLFAGIGGFRMGFTQAGCKCVFSSEINPACQKVYLDNFGEMPYGDITKIDAKDIPDFDILCAGFPCQPFSICGKKLGFNDTRGTLFFDVCRIISEKKPSVVVLENVKHLINHDKGRTFQVIISTLEELGYLVSYKVLDSSKFGVAQCRERIIIIGTKKKCFNFSEIHESKRMTIRQILDKSDKFEYLPKESYTLLDKQYIHQQPTGLIFVGYRNKSIWTKGVRPNTEYLSRCHRQPNRIYSIDGLHPTLPSQETSGRFWIYIPEQDAVRKLTIKECYRLMGYPDNFKIDSNMSNAYRQCGNSVVIPMINELAKSIINQCFHDSTKTNETIRFRANNNQIAFSF